MSDSSSSESEDDSRFKEACDPTFQVSFGGEKTAGGKRRVVVEEEGRDDSDGGETRESFLLAGKIKKSLARTAYHPVGLKLHDSSSTPGMAVHHRKDSEPCNLTLPSSLSSYLAKRLTGLLDKNVKFVKTLEGCEVPNKEYKDVGGNQQSIRLLKNLVTGISIVKDDVPKKRKKIKDKMCYFDSSDEEEIASRCSSLALSPQWILDKQDVYPWPHPKNIRYLEKFKLLKKKDHGVILATSCEKTMVKTSLNCAGQKINHKLNCVLKTEEGAEATYKCVNEANSNIHCVTMPEKYQIKKKGERSHNPRSETSDGTQEIPCKTQKLYLERPDSEKRLRKQSRKRGKKKKIEPTDSRTQ